MVVFDGDTAGQRAAQKAIPLFVDAGILGGRIARLPAGVDPDDFVRQPDHGADAFRRLVEGARPMLDQFIQDAASDANVPDRVTALRAIAALLVKVKDPTTRELYAGQLAGILKMDAPAGETRDAGGRGGRAAADAPARDAGAACPRGRWRRPWHGALAAPAAGQPPAMRLPAEELELLVRARRATPSCCERPRPRAPATCWSIRWRGSCIAPPPSRRPRPEASTFRPGSTRPRWPSAPTIASALKDDRFAELANPAGYLRKLVIRLEILRVDAEIAMNTRLQKEAQARGDDAALRAHSRSRHRASTKQRKG